MFCFVVVMFGFFFCFVLFCCLFVCCCCCCFLYGWGRFVLVTIEKVLSDIWTRNANHQLPFFSLMSHFSLILFCSLLPKPADRCGNTVWRHFVASRSWKLRIPTVHPALPLSPSSDDSFHSPTVIPPSALHKPTVIKRYHESLPLLANVQSHLTSSFADDGNAS